MKQRFDPNERICDPDFKLKPPFEAAFLLGAKPSNFEEWINV